MQELLQYAKWISLEIPKINKKDVKILQRDEPQLTPMVLAYKAVTVLQHGVTNHSALTSCAASVGQTVLIGLEDENLPEMDKSVVRVKVGYFLLNILFDNNKLQARKGMQARDPYTIAVQDGPFIDGLIYSVNAQPLAVKMHTKPSFEKPEPFTKFYHPVAGEMVHKCNAKAREYFKYENCPKVFDAINKHMQTPLKVNTRVLDVLLQCKQDPIISFRGKTLEEEQFIAMKREQTSIFDIAQQIGDKTFWQYMFYDFRGRLYSSMIYFSPQGSKLAKALIRFEETKELGSEGLYWLFVHTANCYGEDKLTLNERHDFTEDRLDEWLIWAEDPVKNKQWQEADSPFEFLTALLEIKAAYDYSHNTGNDVTQFKSGIMVAFDATCSGLQVLSAITRDEKAGKLCNLTNSETRGDYYQMIADHIWPETAYNAADVETFTEVQVKLSEFAIRIHNATKANKGEIYQQRREWMDENREKVRTASRVFWGRPEIKKLARSIVKRPCMTYFYSCQAKTMARSLMSDFRAEPEFEGIQMTYCLWLTNRIYAACKKLMPKATSMMDVFIDMGVADYEKGLDFQFKGPFNDFLFMQNYRNPITKEVWFKYKGKSIRLKVLVGFGDKLTYSKIKSATSPNAVHCLDAQIVSAAILRSDYPINCIHDSFGTTAANAGKLYEDIRTVFVGIFEDDVLMLLEQEKGFECNLELGDLNLYDALDDEYIFS